MGAFARELMVRLAVAAAGANGEAATGAAGESPVVGAPSDFRPYIFWAYGLACVLLFAFCAWGIRRIHAVEDRVRYLDERLQRAHPDRET